MKNKKSIFVKCPIKLRTNSLNIAIDKDAFWDKYAIVTYNLAQEKNLSYERFLGVPYLSVFGCKDYWDGRFGTKFFVLTKRGQEKKVLECLLQQENVRAHVDDLEGYGENQVKWIITSLALNSLSANFENSYTMFSNGILTVWNDDNFTIKIRKSTKEPMVGLDISLNKYLNLTASTKSFCKVRDLDIVRKKWNDYKRLFKVNFTKNNTYTITPFSIKHLEDCKKEKDLYEEKSKQRNVVPFWPFSTQRYQSGKMVVLWNIVKQLNKQFKGLLKVDFEKYPNLVLQESLTEDETLTFIENTLAGRTIFVEDSVGSERSNEYIKMMLNHLRKIYKYVTFVEDGNEFDCKIKLLNNMNDDSYVKGDELVKQEFVTQHLLYDKITVEDHENKENKVPKAKKNDDKDPTMRRIMLELAIKLTTKVEKFDGIYAETARDWTFYKFKQVKGREIIGGKLIVREDGSLNYEDYSGEVSFNDFCKKQLRFKDTQYIDSRKEYYAVERNNNLYLIVRTEETPMMDVGKIDNCYEDIVTCSVLFENILSEYEDYGASPSEIREVEKFAEDEDLLMDSMIRVYDVKHIIKFIKKNNPKFKDSKAKLFHKTLEGQAKVSMFKREKLKEEMLGGYQGIHTWDSKGLNGEDGAFCYMVGNNASNLSLIESTVFDKVPHTHSVFPLRITNKECLQNDKKAILSMLSFGFGRWNEAMNYPFPFKFLEEHIERMCLEKFKQHWKKIKDLNITIE